MHRFIRIKRCFFRSPCFLDVELFCLFTSCLIHSVGAVISAVTERWINSVHMFKEKPNRAALAVTSPAAPYFKNNSQALPAKLKLHPRFECFQKYQIIWDFFFDIWIFPFYVLRNWIFGLNIKSLTRCSYGEVVEKRWISTQRSNDGSQESRYKRDHLTNELQVEE